MWQPGCLHRCILEPLHSNIRLLIGLFYDCLWLWCSMSPLSPSPSAPGSWKSLPTISFLCPFTAGMRGWQWLCPGGLNSWDAWGVLQPEINPSEWSSNLWEPPANATCLGSNYIWRWERILLGMLRGTLLGGKVSVSGCWKVCLSWKVHDMVTLGQGHPQKWGRERTTLENKIILHLLGAVCAEAAINVEWTAQLKSWPPTHCQACRLMALPPGAAWISPRAGDREFPYLQPPSPCPLCVWPCPATSHLFTLQGMGGNFPQIGCPFNPAYHLKANEALCLFGGLYEMGWFLEQLLLNKVTPPLAALWVVSAGQQSCTGLASQLF